VLTVSELRAAAPESYVAILYIHKTVCKAFSILHIRRLYVYQWLLVRG